MRRTKTYSGRPIAFPKTGLLLLILAAAIIFLPRARFINAWLNPAPLAAVANDQDGPPNDSEVDPPVVDLEKPAEPTLDPKERPPFFSALDDTQLREWLSLIKDNTLSLHKREMPAYWRLLSMAKQSDFESLNRDARKAPDFHDFHQQASKHRGELVSMEINIRRVLRYDANEGNAADVKQLYEIWGWTNQSKSWLYVIVTPEIPEGMNEGTLVDQKATFAGYFFKLQAYQSAMNKPTDKPYVAPLMIGRFKVRPSEKKTEGVKNIWPYVITGSLAIAGVVGFTVWSSLRRMRRRPFIAPTSAEPSAKKEDNLDWLEPKGSEHE